jgi:hypothetical protein
MKLVDINAVAVLLCRTGMMPISTGKATSGI